MCISCRMYASNLDNFVGERKLAKLSKNAKARNKKQKEAITCIVVDPQGRQWGFGLKGKGSSRKGSGELSIFGGVGTQTQ